MWKMAVRAWCFVVENLAFEISQSTTFIDRCIKSILPMNLNLGALHFAPVEILGRTRNLSKAASILSHKASNKHSEEHAAIQVTKQINIPPERESPVMGVIAQSGLMIIVRIQTDKPTNTVLPARGFEKVQTHVSFLILVTNFSKKAVSVPKNMLLPVGTEPSERIICIWDAGILIWNGRYHVPP